MLLIGLISAAILMDANVKNTVSMAVNPIAVEGSM